jgi:solute:Na+ symporter, SSS family
MQFGIVLFYLIAMLFIGLYFARKRVKDSDDFMVAGRRLSVPILVGTLLATWIGSGSIIAGAGLAYRAGFAGLWSPSGAWIGICVLFFLAGRARRLAGRTVPEILEARYSPLARILAMVVTVLAYTVITSYQFRAGGFILHQLTGIDPQTGILVTAGFVIAFTALAGMLSVAYTDFVNGVILSVGLIVTLAAVTIQIGGWGEITLPNPVFEGDTIYSQSEVLDKRESRSRPNVGIVRIKTTGFKQDGTIVMTFERTMMVLKRGHAPERPRPRPIEE